MEVSLEGKGSDVGIFITSHDGCIVGEGGMDGVFFGRDVSSEEQVEKKAEDASLGYA
jgi:hypothetical protein